MTEVWLHTLATLVVFLPLAASLAAFVFYSIDFLPQESVALRRHRFGSVLVCVFLLASACSGLMLCAGYHIFAFEPLRVDFFEWFRSGDVVIAWGLQIDALSVVMLCLVSFIAAWICVYSLGYMRTDETLLRFFCYMALFTFSMQMLVAAPNMLQLFLGWEGVGLCSYLLIGYSYRRERANDAAMKAFVVNRVGDWSFILGIVVLAVVYGSVDFSVLQSAQPSLPFISWQGYRFDMVSLACLLLFIGAMAKSAQWGLHVWLADAMEGPTPVSALIHAATMVTAGIFMVIRLSPLYATQDGVLDVMVLIGGLTALLASLSAMTQYDIKRVIAWSTCSQLGYMVLALGLSAWGAALFHLVTHAFFKALLFLAAGSVIYALNHEQDMRRMGGLALRLPVTCAMMWIGVLALAGMPLLSGYYSKEHIVELAWGAWAVNSGSSIAFFGFLAAFLSVFVTAYYGMRLLLMTFHLPSSHHRGEDIRESPFVMLLPMVLFSVFALFLGIVSHDWFVGAKQIGFLGDSLAFQQAAVQGFIQAVPHDWAGLPIVLSLLAMETAFLFYGFYSGVMAFWRRQIAVVHRFLSSGWGMDGFYSRLVVAPLRGFAHESATTIEKDLIDGLGPDGMARFVRGFSHRVALFHDGRLYVYAFVLVTGVLFFLLWQGAFWSFLPSD